MNQISIFGVAAGNAARDQAIAQADDHADDAWRDEAREAIYHLARTRTEFTTDHVHAILAGTDASTHEPRALGALMKQAAKNDLIEPTDRYVPTKRPAAHRRPVRLWRSLL